jgi:hypothetical protein
MRTIELSLTVEETNKIMEALGQMPFVHVHELIGKIHVSATAQVQQWKNDGEEKIKSIVNG